MTFEEFKYKWGTQSPGIYIEVVAERAKMQAGILPETYEKMKELAKDLQSLLENK